MNEQILSIRFKSLEDKNAFLELAKMLHQTPSNLAQEILSNHTEKMLKQKQQLSGFEVFFNRQ